MYILLEVIRQQYLALVPGQFWAALVIVAWFAIPLGERLRTRRG